MDKATNNSCLPEEHYACLLKAESDTLLHHYKIRTNKHLASSVSSFSWSLCTSWLRIRLSPSNASSFPSSYPNFFNSAYKRTSGVILQGNLGEKVSLSWLTSLSWAEGEVKMDRMYREILNLDQNFSLKSWNCHKTSPSLKAPGLPLEL